MSSCHQPESFSLRLPVVSVQSWPLGLSFEDLFDRRHRRARSIVYSSLHPHVQCARCANSGLLGCPRSLVYYSSACFIAIFHRLLQPQLTGRPCTPIRAQLPRWPRQDWSTVQATSGSWKAEAIACLADPTAPYLCLSIRQRWQPNGA